MINRILFVCWADYSHSQSWIDLFKASSLDIRVFATPVDLGKRYPPLTWQYPTYSIFKPDSSRITNKVFWKFPSQAYLRPFLYPLAYKSRVPGLWLAKIIREWKPDLIHSISFSFGTILTWEALGKISHTNRPKWVISSWGSDIEGWIQTPSLKKKIATCIRECDGFIADCYRDINNAKSLGLLDSKLPGDHPLPGTGGLDVDALANLTQEIDKRTLVIIPKAFDNQQNKTLPIVDALRLCEDVIENHQFYFLISSAQVRFHVERLPAKIRGHCTCLPYLPRPELMRMYGSARVMLAPSLSDGTPNVMLEAMALGALPIMSPLTSIREWIMDGENGLLVDALDAHQIAEALQRSLTDDGLCNRAAQINREIINKRANRNVIRSEVVTFYRRIINQPQSSN